VLPRAMILFCLFLANSASIVHLSMAQVAQDLHVFHLFATQSDVRQVMDIEFVSILLTLSTLLTCSTGPLQRFGPNILPSLASHVLATIVSPCLIDDRAGGAYRLEKRVSIRPWLRHYGRYDFVCVHLISSFTG